MKEKTLLPNKTADINAIHSIELCEKMENFKIKNISPLDKIKPIIMDFMLILKIKMNFACKDSGNYATIMKLK